jgi:hypothetical protein
MGKSSTHTQSTMARAPRSTDFTVPIENVGTFTFARRNMGDEMRIQSEYARILDGATPTDWLGTLAGWMATLKVLIVRAPDGWADLDELDPFDPATYAKLSAVFGGLSEKEKSFRGKPATGSEGSGA